MGWFSFLSFPLARFFSVGQYLIAYCNAYTLVCAGESVSMFSFFIMFPKIIFVVKGSVLTAIWIELLVTLGISTWAALRSERRRTDGAEADNCERWCWPSDSSGHAIVGTLLAFLTVFRSQIAFNMYLEGRDHVQALLNSSIDLATELIASLAFQAVELNSASSDSVVFQLHNKTETVLQGADSAAWISKIVGHDAASRIVAEAHKLAVDDGLFQFLDDDGWKELGVSSAIQRANLKRAASHLPKTSKAQREAKNLEIAYLCQEIVRLIKLFYFVCIEHIRSTEGEKAWVITHKAVNVFATDEEEFELLKEFGGVQGGSKRYVEPGSYEIETLQDGKDQYGSVFVAHPVNGNLKRITPSKSASGPNMQRRGSQHPTNISRAIGGKVADGVVTPMCDPTHSKPAMVMTWIHLTVERMFQHGLIQPPPKVASISSKLDAMSDAFHGIDKVDTMVLPFPYAQLLKLFMLVYCFTLPLVVADKLLMWTPVVCTLTSMGFFGLDQVGAELEQPFGLDRNDFPLMVFGKRLCHDLDAVVRTVEMARYRNRYSNPEHYVNAKLAARTLGWPIGLESADGEQEDHMVALK